MTAADRKRFSVGLVQMRCVADPDANLATALAGIRRAADRGAQIVCLPELFRTQYFCQKEDAALFDLAEPIPGPSCEALSAVARERGIAVVGSLFERRARGLYHNTAVVFDRTGELVGSYRKMHIPDDPLFYEKYYFTPGDLGFRAHDTAFGRVGVLVCWDQWYPEGARLTALQGADVLFYPTAIGWHPREKAEYGAAQYDSWRTIQRSHAIANGVHVVSINRVGHEAPAGGDGLEFWGGSFICDPQGQVLTEANHVDETVLVGECDLARAEDVRRNWPFLRDRRIDAYGDITRRYLGS